MTTQATSQNPEKLERISFKSAGAVRTDFGRQGCYAHLYRASGGGWELTFTHDTTMRRVIETRKVASKHEAVRVTAERGATPWNF